MRNYLFILCLALIAQSGITQVTFNSATDSDPKAKKILDNLKSAYGDFQSVSIDFKLEIALPGEQIERQAGSILQKGDKFLFDMGPQALYCNGEEIWIHLKDMNEVQINDFEEEDQSDFMSPKEIFKLYDSGEFAYAISYEGEEQGDFITQIEFKPLDKDSEYSKLRLTLKKNNSIVKRVKVFSKDGSQYTMNITKLDTNEELSDRRFEFDVKAFPGIFVEDLRL